MKVSTKFLFALSLSMSCVNFAQEGMTPLGQAVANVVPDTSKQEFTPVDSLAGNTAATTPAFALEANSPDSVGMSMANCDETKNPYNLPCELMPLWNSMTMKQKAGQMVMVYMTPADFMIKNEFGGYLVMKNHLKDLEKFKKNIQTVNNELLIPPVVAMDQEGGKVNRIAAIAPKWERTPSAKAMRKMEADSVEALAGRIAEVMSDIGVNMNLAPVLDPAVDSRGQHSFMEESDRSWGSDTSNAFKVRAFVSGMRQKGIACVSKHFPGYDSWTNSDHQIAVSATPKKKISQNIRFFKTLSKDIPVTMMSSVRFVRVSNRPAVFEPEIVQKARDMDPETVILTDDLWGVSLRAWVSGTERVKSKNYPAKDFKKLVQTALMAGNDMFMITFPRKAVDMVNYLTAMSKQSDTYKRRVEESSARILKMKYKAGILKPSQIRLNEKSENE